MKLYRIIERKALFLWPHWLQMCRMRMKGEGMEYHTSSNNVYQFRQSQGWGGGDRFPYVRKSSLS